MVLCCDSCPYLELSTRPSLLLLPVDATAAPSSVGGIPNISNTKPAMMHVILAVAGEEADNTLWWKIWVPDPRSDLKDS